jgi:hypothetical protein
MSIHIICILFFVDTHEMDFFAEGASKDSPNSLLSRERVAGVRKGEREREREREREIHDIAQRGREKTYNTIINHLAT